MKKGKLLINKDDKKNKEMDPKRNIGAALFVTGLFIFILARFFPKEDIYSKVTFIVLGILMIVIGAGLYVLGVSVKDKKTQQDINIYVGKQLFEKGLYAFVGGVILGIFGMLTK